MMNFELVHSLLRFLSEVNGSRSGQKELKTKKMQLNHFQRFIAILLLYKIDLDTECTEKTQNSLSSKV